MMTPAQKLIALGMILILMLVMFLFNIVLGIIALFASLPLTFAILRR